MQEAAHQGNVLFSGFQISLEFSDLAPLRLGKWVFFFSFLVPVGYQAKTEHESRTQLGRASLIT